MAEKFIKGRGNSKMYRFDYFGTDRLTDLLTHSRILRIIFIFSIILDA